ncbi:MAG: M23 family metallopeptidase [Candidatus Brachytrichaceae bacterium NZ_4S206]|jgi:murein DD-endopeptidase MepM/ murein hydrolase activator NlpD
MSNRIRKLNFALMTTLVLQAAALFSPSAATAQTSAFLKRPYYGRGPSGIGWTATFDHRSPNYTRNNMHLHYNGVELPSYRNPDGSANCPHGPTYCYDGHSGYDLPLAYQPVVASASGTVIYSSWDNPDHDVGYGLMVEIDHGNSHKTRYGHLSMVRYTPGTAVGNWQIGTSGNTGNSRGAHLHFEVLYYQSGWRTKDPYGWTGGYPDPWQQHTDGTTSEWLWLPYPQREQTPPTYSGDYLLDNDDAYYPNNFVLGCNAGHWSG